MARTFRSEGQRLANILRPLFIGIFMYIYFFYYFPGSEFDFSSFKDIGVFFFFLTLGAGIPQIIGNIWSSYRRSNRNAKRKTSQNKNLKHNSSNSSYQVQSSKDLLMADIDTLTGDDFERLMAMYFKWKGYDVQIIGGSGDHGVDLVLRGKEGYKIAVQCKRWNNNDGNEVVLKVSAGKRMYDCLETWVVTTSYFTPKAIEAAQRHRVRLINGIEVHDMINTMRKHHGIVRSKVKR